MRRKNERPILGPSYVSKIPDELKNKKNADHAREGRMLQINTDFWFLTRVDQSRTCGIRVIRIPIL